MYVAQICSKNIVIIRNNRNTCFGVRFCARIKLIFYVKDCEIQYI